MKKFLLFLGGALMGSIATALFSSGSFEEEEEGKDREDVKIPIKPSPITTEGPKPTPFEGDLMEEVLKAAGQKIDFNNLLSGLMAVLGTNPDLESILSGLVNGGLGGETSMPEFGVRTGATSVIANIPNNLDEAFNEYLGEYYQNRITEGIAEAEVQEEMKALLLLNPIEKVGLISASFVLNQFEKEEDTHEDGKTQDTTA